MRKFVWLTLFAAAALLVSAQQNAFAHPGHGHAPVTQAATALEFEIIFVENGDALYFDTFASSAKQYPVKCQHGLYESLCDECCGCGAHASVALHTLGQASRKHKAVTRHLPPAFAFLLRYSTSDLTRPPKSFA